MLPLDAKFTLDSTDWLILEIEKTLSELDIELNDSRVNELKSKVRFLLKWLKEEDKVMEDYLTKLNEYKAEAETKKKELLHAIGKTQPLSIRRIPPY